MCLPSPRWHNWFSFWAKAGKRNNIQRWLICFHAFMAFFTFPFMYFYLGFKLDCQIRSFQRVIPSCCSTQNKHLSKLIRQISMLLFDFWLFYNLPWQLYSIRQENVYLCNCILGFFHEFLYVWLHETFFLQKKTSLKSFSCLRALNFIEYL